MHVTQVVIWQVLSPPTRYSPTCKCKALFPWMGTNSRKGTTPASAHQDRCLGTGIFRNLPSFEVTLTLHVRLTSANSLREAKSMVCESLAGRERETSRFCQNSHLLAHHATWVVWLPPPRLLLYTLQCKRRGQPTKPWLDTYSCSATSVCA